VAPVDDAPVVLTPIADITVTEPVLALVGSTLVETIQPTVIDLSQVFTDIDNDPNLIVKSIQTNTNPSLVSTSLNGNLLTLNYAANQFGTAQITVLGTSNGLTVADTFTVTANSVYNLITGTSANDSLNGTTAQDKILGLAGDDKLDGKDGNDVIYGGDGRDDIKGYKGNDFLFGNAGDDKLSGEDNDDVLIGGQGADELLGGNGNDTFLIQVSNEAEFDVFNGGSEDLTSKPQGDTILNASGSAVIFNGFNDSWDIETFDGGGYAILGNSANNSLDFRRTTLVNVPYVDGGIGDDDIKGSIASETLRGGTNNDKIDGNDGNDTLYGDAGLDELKGGKGTDQLFCGDGNDKLQGEDDNDVLIGGTGSDQLEGGNGEDTLIGVDPNSAIAGRNEIDVLKGNSGNDLFVLGDSTRIYYDDGIISNAGLNDYALIDDFKSGEDKIRLKGSISNYVLSPASSGLPGGTAIYLKTSGDNELIAVVKGVNNLTTSAFTFV
jgi:Ca2+-binding RTX toxin-like protein